MWALVKYFFLSFYVSGFINNHFIDKNNQKTDKKNTKSIVMVKVLPKVLPDRTLLLPLARSVLRLNRLDGGRLKSESDPCDTAEAANSERSGPAGPRFSFQSSSVDSVMDTTAGCGACSFS